MTLAETAQQAMDIQDACNLSGVAHAYSAAMHVLFTESERLHEGTEWRNHHPIVTLFLSKMCSLNGGIYDCNFYAAWEACEALAKGIS